MTYSEVEMEKVGSQDRPQKNVFDTTPSILRAWQIMRLFWRVLVVVSFVHLSKKLLAHTMNFG
jgi:hypothetical protein